MKIKKITEAARGRECTIQIHPYCNCDPETTAFCHAPSEKKGKSLKSPDFWGAFGCSVCHDIVDLRFFPDDIPRQEVIDCHIRGIFRTQYILFSEGIVK